MMDGTRDPYNPANDNLYPDLTNAEAYGGEIDFVSNGFKIRTSTGSRNESGTTYFYMAFAEDPYKYGNSR